MTKMMTKIIGFSVLVLLLMGCTMQESAKNKFDQEVEKGKEAVKLLREVQRGGYHIITTEQLKKWIDAGKHLLIIDTMPYQASFKKAHVPGTKQSLFPIPEMKNWETKETANMTQGDYKALLGPNKNKIIVIYCGLVKCTLSHNGSAWAVKLGYKYIYRYPGGIFAWKGANDKTAIVN